MYKEAQRFSKGPSNSKNNIFIQTTLHDLIEAVLEGQGGRVADSRIILVSQ